MSISKAATNKKNKQVSDFLSRVNDRIIDR